MKKCSKCQQMKPLNCFAKRNDRKSGYQSVCNDCRKVLYGRKEAPNPTLTEKWCSKCTTTKPITAFSRNRAMKDGYNWWCKDCANSKGRTHYAANLDKEHAKSRAKIIRRKPQIKAYQAQWYKDNKAMKDAQNAQWFAEHPGMRGAYAQTYRARINAAPVNDLTEAQWQEILVAYNHRCVYCPNTCKECRNKTHVLEREHLTPISKGGSHTVPNIVPACVPCNRRKHTGNVPVAVQPLLLTIERAK